MSYDNKNNSLFKSSQGMEEVKTRSGKWYSLSNNDIQCYINDTIVVLREYISQKETIGLFIDFDSANLNSIILYHACIACGGTVIRCSISDLERQLPIINGASLDIIISSSHKEQYLRSKLEYKRCFLIDSIECETQKSTKCDLYIQEFYDIPGMLFYNSDRIICPGYDVEIIDENNSICINTKKSMQFIRVDKYIIDGVNAIHATEQNGNSIIKNFISLQIRIILSEFINGVIAEDDIISLNSISMVELLIRTEEEFGISIPLEKVSKDSFSKIKNIEELILSTILEKAK